MYNQYPYSSFAPSTYNMMQPASSNPSGIGSLLGLGRKNFSWDGFLNNAQKTLNVINQAMPIYNQVKPMFRNMGTVFRVMSELNKGNAVTTATSPVANTANVASTAVSTPPFFA